MSYTSIATRLAESVKEHICKENFVADNEQDWKGREFIWYGHCGMCGKKLKEIYVYSNTKEIE